MNLAAVRSALARRTTDYKHAVRTVKAEREALAYATRDAANAAEAQQIVQTVAQTVQQQAHRRIADVVSKCLAACFDKPYEFVIHFDRKRGKTEARLAFVRDGVEFLNPRRQCGGGAVDVAAFALRVACLMLATPRRRRTLFIDEGFKNVNGDRNQDRVAGMLETLAKDLDVQFILVSDDEWLKIGKVIEV